MYSEGAMNSIVAFWTSGLLCGSPYDLLTGLYINSSGTRHIQKTLSEVLVLNNDGNTTNITYAKDKKRK